MGGSPDVDSTLLGALADDTDADSGAEQRETVVRTPEHGHRLDKVLTALAPEFSRNHLQGLIESGQVRLEGTVVTQCAKRLKVGQHLSVTLLPPAESRAFLPQPMALRIVYEDAHVLVIDKPAGLVVHPAPGNWSGTLLNGLLARDPRRCPVASCRHRPPS